MTGQPWIQSPRFDGAFILSPPLVLAGLVLLFADIFRTHDVSPLIWAVLIVGVDVAHVYSTLYRTYFDPAEFQQRRTLYLLAPLLGWLGFAALYSLGAMVFWRALAYLAVFHFVRQQYGFMMIYGRHERRYRRLDKAAIYLATLYPLVWWHLHPRRFSWFVDGDFLSAPAGGAAAWLWDGIGATALLAYVSVMAAYACKEAVLWRRTRQVNLPRNLLLLGTALSWGVGIMALDSDLAFTAVNVLAHGIPYMALIWIYGRNQAVSGGTVLGMVPASRFFSWRFVPVFLGLPILLAYFEEGLWDGMVWTERPGVFGAFTALPAISDHALLTWLVPLLALPQITHYVLDAFIWRLGRADTPWRRTLLGQDAVTAP